MCLYLFFLSRFENLIYAVVHEDENVVFAFISCGGGQTKHCSVFDNQETTSSYLLADNIFATWVQSCLYFILVSISENELETITDSLD